LFFLKAALPDRLRDAPGGSAFLSEDAKTVTRGKEVFADTCARCHSSKGPPPPATLELDPDKCAGAAYLACFKRYWSWTQTDEFKRGMRAIVAAPDFLTGNYMSSDARIPATLLRTNVCSPLATNALAGNIWDNFSSQSYKQLPSVGTVTVYDPFTGDPLKYPMPANGRGYTRVPSLIGLWSTAPFLLNNSVGPFSGDPSVAGRMKAFDASIEQMLWPEKRDPDSELAGKVPGRIDRTTERSNLFIPAGYVPEALRPLQGAAHRWLPRWVSAGGDVELGPIPKGMPVGLVASLKLRVEPYDTQDSAVYLRNLSDLLLRLKADLLLGANASDEELGKSFANLRGPLLANSKCPDFVVNRGHYFGTAQFNDQAALSDDERAFGNEPVLSDGDKHALIAFLKTF
jgi:hypothetical protein